MTGGLVVGVALVVAGVILLAVGLSGTFSLTQTVIGGILVGVGAITLKAAAGRFCGVRAVRRGIGFVPVGACVVADEVVVARHTPAG